MYLRVRFPIEVSRALKLYECEFVQPKAACLQGSVEGGEGAAGGALEDAVDFGGPHGVEGGFYDDAARLEGGVSHLRLNDA